jgi:hypothetical protein
METWEFWRKHHLYIYIYISLYHIYKLGITHWSIFFGTTFFFCFFFFPAISRWESMKTPTAESTRTRWAMPCIQKGICFEGFFLQTNGFNGILMGYNGIFHLWLVVDLPLWKMMEWKSVGRMTFPTEWKNKKCSKPPTRYRPSNIKWANQMHSEAWWSQG